jgi:hypothetical protein
MERPVKMIFKCDQDWDQMESMGTGRYCTLCNKVVHDFTERSIEEIPSSKNGELCGMFRVEQLEPDLIPIKIPGSVKAAVITLGTLVGLEVNEVHGQDATQKERIEIVESPKGLPDSIANDIVAGAQPKTSDDTECTTVKRRPKARYFFSKRFPFIKKRYVRLGGRFRH